LITIKFIGTVDCNYIHLILPLIAIPFIGTVDCNYIGTVECSYVYWTTIGNDSGLWRSTLEGSDMKRLASGIVAPNGLYLDSGSQSIYVLDGINGSVFQCTLKDTGKCH